MVQDNNIVKAEEVKIAYLLLCYKNSEQVSRLIDQLSNESVTFFIHVDKKIKDFNLIKRDNVFVLPDEKRVDVRWASFSMIQATINLLRYMVESGKQYDYVILLSGQDFPLKSNDEIQDFLLKNKGLNFIDVIEHDEPRYSRYLKRSVVYYPYFLYSKSFFGKAMRKIWIYISGGSNHTFSVFKRRVPENMKFEYGSQWWGLTFDCVKWIVEYIEQHGKIVDYFRHSMTPDESFFQTIFMKSPFINSRHGKLVFVQWGENKNNPRIFSKADYELLVSQNSLFARKFDTKIDNDIVDRLVEHNS